MTTGVMDFGFVQIDYAMNWKSLGPADKRWIESFGDSKCRRNWKDLAEPGVLRTRSKTRRSKEETVVSLKVCSETKDLERGKELAVAVLTAGLLEDKVVAAALINMYCKCGSMASAREVFDSMSRSSRDVVTWTSLILGYLENGEAWVAMDVFACMDCVPDLVTLVVVIKSCSALVDDKLFCLGKGMALHRQIKELGLETNTVIANTLVAMYSKCGCMISARAVFQNASQRNTVTWNSLLAGYAENGECSLVLDLFKAMDCRPDSGTYVAALKACAGLAAVLDRNFCVLQGQGIHQLAQDCGLGSNILVANTLLDVYIKCGSMTSAHEAFDSMARHDVVTWNCLISGYAQTGQSSLALSLFFAMDCEPNLVTIVAALKACAATANVAEESEREVCLKKGVVIHRQIQERGTPPGSELVVANALLDMYGKCGSMAHAQDVFDGMVQRNATSWTCLILGYVESSKSWTAISLFMSMDCEPDCTTLCAALKACRDVACVVSGKVIHSRACELGVEQDERLVTGLVDMYGRCGCMSAAQLLFDGALSRSICVSTALVTGYSLLGHHSQVFELVGEMQEAGLRMDAVTFVCVLTACSHAGRVEDGTNCFSSMLATGIIPSLEHYNCLVDMLTRARRLEEADKLIKYMPEEASRPVKRTLLGAYR